MANEASEKLDPLDALIERGLTSLRELSRTVLDGRKPPAGTYAFFSHNAHALSRLQDCRRIYHRLRDGRARLTELELKFERYRPKQWPAGTPYPPEAAEVGYMRLETGEHMKLDLESLYVFGTILLDQWSLQALAVGSIAGKRNPLPELIDHLEAAAPGSLLKPIWNALRREMLWLLYQLRFYRNRFVVHADRPWQRGTTASVYGDSFNLFTPTPAGWLDDEDLDRRIAELLPLAPSHFQTREVYWERKPARLIEVLFDRIAEFDKDTRERIWQLFRDKGGSTPSFQRLAGRLFSFVAEGTALLVPIAAANIANVRLGEPHSTTDGLWAALRAKRDAAG